MSKHRKQPERRYSHQAPLIASTAAGALAGLIFFVAGLATSGSATAADLLDPIQLAQAQKANCQLLAAKATSTAQRTRANQCVTDQTRILQLLQSPSPTPPATTTPAPTTTQPPVTTAPPTTPPATTPPATTQPPVTTPPTTAPPATSQPPSGWPGASNTGVPAGVTLTAYSGPCTITSANTVIDARNISCPMLSILATGVVVKRSLLHGIVGDGFRVEDSTIDTTPNNDQGFGSDGKNPVDAVSGTNFVVLRVNAFGSNRQVNCSANSGGLTSTVQDSWLHGTEIPTGSTWHASGMRVEIGCNVLHNTIACDIQPTSADGGCSADLTQYPDFNPVHHNTIIGNRFVANSTGNAFCMYGGMSPGKQYSNDPSNATFIVVKDNVFERGSNRRCAAYGPVDVYDVSRTGNVWSGNVWEDGGAVNP